MVAQGFPGRCGVVDTFQGEGDTLRLGDGIEQGIWWREGLLWGVRHSRPGIQLCDMCIMMIPFLFQSVLFLELTTSLFFSFLFFSFLFFLQ